MDATGITECSASLTVEGITFHVNLIPSCSSILSKSCVLKKKRKKKGISLTEKYYYHYQLTIILFYQIDRLHQK